MTRKTGPGNSAKPAPINGNREKPKLKTEKSGITYPTRRECICLLLDKEKLIQIIAASERISADARLIQELLPGQDNPDMIFCLK